MAFRWAITALVEAERRFRRIRGFRSLPQLINALQVKTGRGALDIVHEVA